VLKHQEDQEAVLRAGLSTVVGPDG
jgi:hypothetical protein